MKAFKNVPVYITGEGIKITNVLFDEKIISIGGEVDGAEILPVPKDAVVYPGFIDQHIHGANGSDAMDASEEDLKNIAVSIAKEGVTSFLATTMTERKEKILKALANSTEKAFEAGKKWVNENAEEFDKKYSE